MQTHEKYGIALRSASPTIIDGTEVPCYRCVSRQFVQTPGSIYARRDHSRYIIDETKAEGRPDEATCSVDFSHDDIDNFSIADCFSPALMKVIYSLFGWTIKLAKK